MATINKIHAQGADYELEDTQAREQIAKLIESGGEHGNRFTKLADGTLICYGWKTVPAISVGLDWGALAYGYIPFNLTFPHAFIGYPVVHVSANNISFISINPKSDADVTNTGINNLFITSAEKRNITNMSICYQAIGRWK